MLKSVAVDGYGTGTERLLLGTTRELYFGHSGHNIGYISLMAAHPEAGVGVVILTNGDNTGVEGQILDLVAKVEGWPGF